MRLGAQIGREWRFLTGLNRTLGRVRGITATSENLICDDFERAVDRWRERTAILFEGRSATYAEIDAIANRYANWAREQGIARGSTVALFLPNRLDYLPAWMGLTKVGVAAALINNTLSGAALIHCLAVSGAFHVIADAETSPVLDQVIGQSERSLQHWTLGPVTPDHRDLNKALKGCSSIRPDRRSARDGLTAADTALYIYTSGTTGLPKAARITHMRAQLYMRGFAGATGATEADRVYVTLPLYHATGGLCGMGAALLTGGSVLLRRKFSASHFWSDVAEGGCTLFVYVGELCRYLLSHPPHEDDGRHKIRLAFGNGLSREVWEELRVRFNRLNVLEFYGSTEGNVSMFNFDGRVGAIGRIPAYLKGRFPVRLAQFDVETEEPVRGPDGLCREVGTNQIGECLGKVGTDVRSAFSGYADKKATDRKILKDVFEKGDRWFRTGDLMRQDRDGYFYFVDRIGDTFRWKGENVATTEVAACLSRVPGVEEVNVYGVKVPHAEGRAGMAALVVGEGFDLSRLAKAVSADLPTYAQPLFLRLSSHLEVTGTFKPRKMDLVQAGFDPEQVADPLFIRTDSGAYEPLSAETHARIVAGEIRL